MDKIVKFTMLIIMIFLGAHLCILYGAVKEREGRVCVDPVAMNDFDKTIAMARAVCVDMAKQQLEENKSAKVDQKANADYWRKKYDALVASTTQF